MRENSPKKCQTCKVTSLSCVKKEVSNRDAGTSDPGDVRSITNRSACSQFSTHICGVIGSTIPIFCTGTDKAFIECSAIVLSIFILILLILCKAITVNSFYQNRRLRQSWGHTASKGKGQDLNPGSPSISEAKNLKFFYFIGCHTLSFFFMICI